MSVVARWMWVLALVAAPAAAQDIPIGNEPVKIGSHKATSTHKPWATSWVPATSDEMPTALETFSRLLAGKLGFNPRLHELERFNHFVGPGSPIRAKYEKNGVNEFGWWGHCNGEACAVTLEKQPPATVTRTVNGRRVTIPQDQLSALLAEAYYEASAMSRGTRSFLSDTQYTEAKRLMGNSGSTTAWKSWYKNTFKREAPSSYTSSDIKGIAREGVMRFEDMNPAEMHRTLRTVIGKAKIPMVFETSAGEAVWNWAAWEYQTNVKDTGRTTRGGLKVLDVKTTVETMAGPKDYTYELYVDRNNVIKDGKWTGSSVTNHPDFIWSGTDPRFRLNEFMAKAVTNNLNLGLGGDKIEAAVRSGDRAALADVRKHIAEVWDKAAPKEVMDSRAMTDVTYKATVDAVRKWNSDPSLQWRYGNDVEVYLEATLAEKFARNGRFNVDLYKEVSDLLPPGNRAVTDVEAKIRKAAADPTPMDRAVRTAGRVVREEAAGAAQFAAAYLVKEGLKALETGDPERMKQAVVALKDPKFWGGVAVFSIVSRASHVVLNRLPLTGTVGGLAKAAVPLAVGMAALQIMSGQFSAKDVAISTGAFLAAGMAVNLLADALVYPALFAAGPPGWIAAGVYSIGKLALTLYFGEKLEAWLHGLFNKGGHPPQRPTLVPAKAEREGIKQQVEKIDSAS